MMIALSLVRVSFSVPVHVLVTILFIYIPFAAVVIMSCSSFILFCKQRDLPEVRIMTLRSNLIVLTTLL